MTRKQFMAEIAKYPGVTLDLESERDGETLILDSAAGKKFLQGSHCLVEQYRNVVGQSWKPKAYADLVERLKDGLIDCTDDECDTCHPEAA